MRLFEILLPPGIKDRDLSPKDKRHIDMLQHRMQKYADKIGDPNTPTRARDFLKAKLKADYDELKDIIETVNEAKINELSKNTLANYTNKSHGDAKINLQKAKDNGPDKGDSIAKAKKRMGGMKQAMDKIRKINTQPVSEAVTKLPLTPEDFDLVKELMSHPIPAAVAPIYIQEIIEDDEFSDQLRTLEDTEPGRDVRPLVVEWFKRVMPDQMFRFSPRTDFKNLKGEMSIIHGYDPQAYHSPAEPVTGNAFGSFY